MKVSHHKHVLTRRDLLKAGALVVVAAPLLAACQQPTAPAATQAPKATEAPKPAATTAPAAPAQPAATQAPAAAATKAPKAGGTYTAARTVNMKNFNGVDLARGNMSWLRSLYGYLVRLDKDLNPQPEMAESWQISPDGLTMTVKLRQGVKFHSGRDFTSEDVDATVYETRVPKGDFDGLVAHNYGRVNRDPGTTLSGVIILYNKDQNGPVGFDLPEFVKARDEAAGTMDGEKRKALYRKVQQIHLDESFSMPIAGNQSYWIYRNYVKNVAYNRESSPFTVDMWLDK